MAVYGFKRIEKEKKKRTYTDEQLQRRRNYSKKWRSDNKEHIKKLRTDNKVPYAETRKRKVKEQTDFINQTYKVGKPCVDCGLSFHFCAMDFHHRSTEDKIDKISNMIGRRKMEVIIMEIAKCDLLCAVCHRLRHWKLRQGL